MTPPSPTNPPATSLTKSLAAARATKILVRVSLAANIVVLIAVCTVLIAFSTAEPVTYVWGQPSHGRGILLSVYFAILAASMMLLCLHVRCADKAPVEYMVAALLAVQILYKITTPASAGPANPVAISNLCISVLHSATLFLLWRQHNSTKRQVSAEATL